MAQPIQPSFSKGEIAPGLQNRVDLALYGTALKTCRNFVVQRLGGVQTRPATRFVSPSSRPAATARFIRFVFSRTQSYLLEFCAGRTWIYQNGARLTFGTPVANILDVTTLTENGISAVAVFPTYFQFQTYIPHYWATGEVVRVSGVTGTGEIDHANGIHEITVTGINLFTVPRPTSGAAAWTSSGTGRVSRCVSVVTPYTQDELAGLRVAQSADVMTVFSRNHPPHELRRTSATVFTFAEKVYKTGPLQRDNSDESVLINATAARGTVGLAATADIFEADHVGALIRLDATSSSVEPWEPGNGVSIGDRCRYGENTYLCVGGNGITTGNTPPEHTRGRERDGQGSYAIWEYQHSGYGVARIVGYTNARTVTATVISRFPTDVVGGVTVAFGPWTMTGNGTTGTLAVAGATSDQSSDYEVTLDGVIQPIDDYVVTGTTTDIITFATPPASGVAVSVRQLSANKRTHVWSLGAWSEVQGYPGVGSYSGDRLVFGSTTAEPQRLDLTEVGNYDGFKATVPQLATDPIDLQLGGREMSAITDLVPLDQLAILTEGGGYRLSGGDQDTVTPTNAAIKRVIEAVPSADSPAMLADKAAVYIGRGRRRIHDLAMDAAGSATGDEVSLSASHLLGRGQTADGGDYQSLPESIVWLVRSDGVLLSMTYLKAQDVIGWAWHETSGTVEQVCVVPEGDQDVVYLLVRRTVGETVRRFVEVMTDREADDRRDIVCVDCSLSYDGRVTDGTTATLYQSGSDYTVSASAAFFTDDHIGKEVWLYGPVTVRCLILSRVNSLQVIVQPDLTDPVPAGVYAIPLDTWAIATNRLTGLKHLVGETVSVQIDAGVHAPTVVADDGSVSLDVHTAVAHAGLPFTANIETLPINFIGRETVRTKQKLVNGVHALIVESQGLEAGIDADHLESFQGRDLTDDYEIAAAYTGAAEVPLESTWGDTGAVQLWQRQPLPLTIVGVIPNVKVGR